MIDEVYDENYYSSHCGIPYHRDEPHWYKFFGNVAREIKQRLGPKTVFDAGCAMGFLVEALREQGIEAYGRDLSNYAIEQVPSGLKAYVERGSISDPIENTFDLVTCIEVLEHMTPYDGRRAVENICRVAPKVLFSSSHKDFTEETHINVQPPIYWIRLFADHDFGPVSGFDGSFLCPWAILFQRRQSRPTDSELEAQADLVLARMHVAEAVQRAHQHHQDQLARLTEDMEQRHRDQLARLTEDMEQRHRDQLAGVTAETKRLHAAEVGQLRASLVAQQKRLAAQERKNSDRGNKILFRRRRSQTTSDTCSTDLAAQEESLRNSGLFDAQWYLQNYPDVAHWSSDALNHYLTFGAGEGRRPNPAFDTSYYVETYPEVQASGLNPLYHYLTIGSAANLKPAADFDPGWYRETYPDAVRDGTAPLLHYLKHGRLEGRRGHAGDSGAAVTDARIKTVKVQARVTELALLVTHAPGGCIKPHVFVYIDALKAVGLSVCLIVAADDIDAIATDTLADRVDGLLVRENIGFDFAAWAHAAHMLDMSETQLLVLTNDSIIGPFTAAGMQAVAGRIRSSDAQLIGLTDNHEIRYHFQSYFLAAKGAGVSEVVNFLAEVRSFRHKQDVISCYETTLLGALREKGVGSDVLFPTSGTTNRTTTQWRDLIQEGFPFLKVEVIKTCEPEQWKPALASTGFDVRVAEESLKILRAFSVQPSPTSTALLFPPTQQVAAATTLPAASVEIPGRTAWLEQELTKARRKPWRLVGEKFKFKVYSALSRLLAPLSPKTAARYAEKARKRHPQKYLSATSGTVIPRVGTRSETLHPGDRPHDPAKRNVLVISHQASRTGAPILALNIAQRLSARYNVISICMSGGDLMKDFAATSECAYDAGIYSMNPDEYNALLDIICHDREFEFAVVNSIESHAFLKGLRDRGVPTVALLHEFASYTQDRRAFRNAVDWADETVFSSQVTLDNALDTGSFYMSPRLHISPQGRCAVPARQTDAQAVQAEQTRLRNILRPASASPDLFVVLGAGTVEIRKGVDLFFAIASQVLRSEHGKNFRFVWIGAGYNPDVDFAYSVYLKDQIRRAGIEEHATIISSTTEIELAYELTDLLLLSSRLDPLPNVVIDSMCLGRPVVCFDKASGAAALLAAHGLSEACVADYLDTGAMAEKIIKLGLSRQHYNYISKRTLEFSVKTFDIDNYVNTIEALGLTAKARATNVVDDIEAIVSAGTLRADFFQPPGQKPRTPRQLAEDFVRRLGSATGMRKPEPGFDPFAYACLREDFDHSHDPYAAFLHAGRPEGPWLLPVLDGGRQATQNFGASPVLSALHIHAYFLDSLPDVVNRLNINNSHPDLFISVPDDESANKANKISKEYNGRVISIQSCQNRGRDIGPFLTEFGPRIVTEYEVIGHIHLKQSAHLKDGEFVTNWTAFILENIIGGKTGGTMIDLILARFHADSNVGIIFADDPHLVGWTRNRENATKLAERMGFDRVPDAINFPVGTMFWMRSEVLRRFVDLELRWDDYPSEPIDNDGTSLHALERLFGVVPQLDGWSTVVTNIRGVTR